MPSDRGCEWTTPLALSVESEMHQGAKEGVQRLKGHVHALCTRFSIPAVHRINRDPSRSLVALAQILQ